MDRTLFAGAASLFLIAACATTKPRPTAAPPHAGTKPVTAAKADPFHGCHLAHAMPGGYDLACGDLEAMVLQGSDAVPAAKRVDRALAGAFQASGSPKNHRETTTLRLAGADRKVIVVHFTGDKGAAQTGMVAAYDTADHHGVNLACGGPSAAAKARCPALLAHMAAHPSKAPQLPGDKARDASAWPSKQDLAGLGDCDVARQSSTMVRLICQGDVILLKRIGDDSPGVRAHGSRILDRLGAASLEAFKKKFSSAATMKDQPCHVGADDTHCKRIAAPGDASKAATLLLGEGRIFGAYALVDCVHPGQAAGFPAGCGRFLHAPAGASAPTGSQAGAAAGHDETAPKAKPALKPQAASKPQTSQAAPPADATADESWLPDGYLGGLAGCARPPSSPGMVELRCGKTDLTLYQVRKTTAATPEQSAKDTVHYAATTTRDALRNKGATHVTLKWVDCQVGHRTSQCGEIRFGTTAGDEVALLAAGQLDSGDVIGITCLYPVSEGGLPAVCGRFVQVGAAGQGQ